MQNKEPMNQNQQHPKKQSPPPKTKLQRAEEKEQALAVRARSAELRRSAEQAKKQEKAAKEEERLHESVRRRNLKEAKKKERDDRRASRAAYRETHPGFYDPSLRLHSILSVLLGLLGVFFAAALLFKDSVGIIGGFLSDILLGTFSYTAYLIPILMLVHAFYWRIDVRDRTLVRKAVTFVPTLIFAAALASVIAPGFSTEGLHASVAYQNGIALSGGGVMGEFVARTLCRYLGKVGLWLIAITVFIFFLALYFRTLVKRLYVAARAKIKAALVARAKRRAEEKEAALTARAAEADPSTPPDGKGLARVEAREGHLLAKEKKQELATNRRRALFAGLEDDLSVDRDRLTSGNRGKQVFNYEESGENRAPVPLQNGNSSAPFSGDDTPRGASAGSTDFPPDRLPVTRERIRPVRVSHTDTQSEPEPASHETAEKVPEEDEDRSSMEYFRKITVAATREEEELSSPPPRSTASGASARVRFAKEPEKEPTPTSDDIEAYDSFSDEGDDDALENEDLTAAPPPRRASAPTAPRVTEKAAPAQKTVERPMSPAKPTPPPPPQKPPYRYPPLSLLAPPEIIDESSVAAEIRTNAEKLITTLDSFKVRTQVTGYSRGPRITRYEVVPEAGVRVRTIAGLVEDISMSLATSGIRIEAPIPGKSAVGVEVPNTTSTLVRLRGLLDTPKFREAPEKTLVCLGSDVAGQPVYCDLAKMPHMLVAGATGMGKSVCINSIITSILYKATPDEVKLIMVDPKQVEFGIYSGIPHLLVPVVTDPKKAAGALSWAVGEMERRFTLIKDAGVRDIKSYNREMAEAGGEQLPKIVIIIDELHDLMMSAADAVETSIARIAAKARAAGIHLLIGTQRPSVDVITGTIKANIPSRIAFHVSSNTDSRTILDFVGAEKLLTQGDMLFNPAGAPKPHRVQGAFVDDKEIDRIVAFLKENNPVDEEAAEQIMADIEREAEKCTPQKKNADDEAGGGENVPTDYDDQHLLWAALEVGFEFSRLSTSLLQRKLKIGYGKAAKILDELYERDYITAPQGSKPREIRITREEFKELMAREVEDICGGDF